MDRYYQRHKSFDEWQPDGKHFICRIKASTKKTEIRVNPIEPGGMVFYSRSKYRLMVQILAGLITYLLLAIYCHNQYHEKVSVRRLREICINIRNENSISDILDDNDEWAYLQPDTGPLYANP